MNRNQLVGQQRNQQVSETDATRAMTSGELAQTFEMQMDRLLLFIFDFLF